MNIVLISIGDELLAGDTINSNVAWIGRELTPLGCSIIEHRTIPDNKESIQSTLKDLSHTNAKYIITTGGLGPTDDDITRQAIFEFMGTESFFDEKYWDYLTERFKQFGIEIPESNRNQALIPKKGKVIPNKLGSARGLHFELNDNNLICLPGVPSEMKLMMTETVIPEISNSGITPKSVINIRTTGIAESALIELINPITRKNQNCKIGYYPSLIGVDIRITGMEPNEVESLGEQLINALGKYYFTTGIDSIESIVIDLGKQRNKTLCVAESCTGGLIGHRLTETSGSSNVFLGGFIVYSNEAKKSLLNVKKDTLDTFGAVSEETAREMAKNVKSIFNADFGLAVTGIAGPTGGTPDKPVGLIYIGLADDSGVKVKKIQLGAHRKNNKLRTSQIALNWLRLSLKND